MNCPQTARTVPGRRRRRAVVIRRRARRPLIAVLVAGMLVSVLAAVVTIGMAYVSGSWMWSATVGAVVLILPAGGQILARRRATRSAGAPGTDKESRTHRLLTGACRAGVLTTVVALLVSSTWLWSKVEPLRTPEVPGTTYVELGDGTRLAVYVNRADKATRPPLVIAHGGPAVADMTHDVDALGLLNQDRDIYIYDQLGAGRSSRLADPSGYTEQRAMEDLARVVEFTSADQVALLGHSWGARTVTRYAVSQPGRVSAVVLSAPGHPPTRAEGGKVGDPTRRLPGAARLRLYGQLLRPRNLFLYALGKADLAVAHDAAGDGEMDARFARIYEKTRPGLFCDPTLAGRLGIEGVGHFAHHVLAVSNTDPLDASYSADEVARMKAPVLLVKPSCDYLPWSVVPAYADLFKQARVVVLPGAGHQAYNEQPDAYAELVDAFLTGRPLPEPMVRPDVAPDSYFGER